MPNTATPVKAKPVIVDETTPRRIPCKRCLNHYVLFPTKDDQVLEICCDDESASEKCTRCKLNNESCEKISSRAVAVSKKLHKYAQEGYTAKFKKYQDSSRKMLGIMRRRSGEALKSSKREEEAMKQRAASARQASLLKVGLDIANSLSVIAEVLATYTNVSVGVDPPIVLCAREVGATFADVLADEEDEIDAAPDVSDEEEGDN